MSPGPRLRRVFFAAQDLPADPQHHGTVPVDDRCESRLGTLAMAVQKSLEQLPVSQTAGVCRERASRCA